MLKIETANAPEHIAAIDLGSNSFHMVVARIEHGEIRVIDKYGEKVQLAAGLDANGVISDEAQERALACLSRFAQRIEGLEGSAVQIVGTNALRAAKKKTHFLREAEKLTGYPIEIISGREEARLIYLGVAHTLSDDSGNRLVIDIGGGSTELIVGERFETKALESLHMGCVSFRSLYFPDGTITKSGFNRAVRHASLEILSIKRHYKNLGWENCVGSSGTVKAILNAMRFLSLAEETIEWSELKLLRDKILELGHVDRLTEIGVKKERASIFASGLTILFACFEELNIKSMQFTTGALREGLLYDMLGRIRHEDVRERSLTSMQLRYGVDVEQSKLVEETALYLYEQVSNQWDLSRYQGRSLLTWASRVFEVGLSIAHSQYHKHGAYLVQYSDMPGFTRLTQLYLSVIVRLHRRKFSDEPFIDLSDEETLFLKKLCVIFRLAVVLTSDRKKAVTVGSLSLKDESTLQLSMPDGWRDENPLIVAYLELEQDLLLKQNITINLL